MLNTFPPSSPVLGATAHAENPFYQPSSDDFQSIGTSHFSGKRRVDQLYDNQQHYPTPVASSSTGRSSSPIRAPDTTSKCHGGPSKKSFPIELDPRGCTRLAIGRKKSVCDIVLPSKKHISRQHAFITYLPERNEIKLECNGVNGIIVVVPQQMECRLKKSGSVNSYQLLTGPVDSSGWANEKDIESSIDTTSFVLLKNESVFMPYVQGTVIDFRQAEAHLTLMELQDEDDANNTETEDEALTLIPQNGDYRETTRTPRKFITVPQSPPTVKSKSHFDESEFEPSHISPRGPPSQLVDNSSPESVSESHWESHCEPRSEPIRLPLHVPLHVPLQKTLQKTLPELQPKPQPESLPEALPESLEETSSKAAPINTTPVSSPIKNIPTTPVKAKKNVIIKQEERSQSTPLPVLHEPVPILASQQLLDVAEGQHKRKQHKPNNKLDKTAEILKSLEERGIPCKELQHALANHLAFANVQQTPLYQLQQVNSKTGGLSRNELRALLKDVRCIGIIRREGRDAAGKPLDEEYYYDLENDPDTERRNLVTSLKGGRSGLRSCRRTHKQYFWKKPAK